MTARARFSFLPLVALAASIALHGARAGDAGYKDLKIQDLLGASWPEFAAELDSLLANPRNEDGFYRMYKIAQRSDAESKVPQFLLKLSREHPEKKQIQTLLGLFYRENRDYAQAASYFQSALKNQANDYFVHFQLAHLLGKQDGDVAYKDALEHYRFAADSIGNSDLELKTRMLEEWGQLLIDRSGADANSRKTSRGMAAQVWDRLIADERRFDKVTYERLARIYQRAEMWEKAIATYRLFLANVGGDDVEGRVRVLDEIGALFEQLNDFSRACAGYSEALTLVDETHWLHKQLVVKLVKAHKKAGDGGAFLTSLQKAAQDRPLSTVPLRDLALVFENLGDNASAIHVLEQAVALAPRDVTIISDLLLHYSKAGPESLSKKAELYRQLAAIMPGNFDAYVGLADTYWELGDAAKVQEALNMLQYTASAQPEKYRVMAGAFRKYGMKSNARNAYERALTGSFNTDAALEFCDFCLACAETEGAGSESLRRALELRNGLMAQGVLGESGYLRLMEVFKSHQRPNEARDIAGYAATNAFPKSFVCRAALADLHYSRKEFHKAIQHYAAALELAPSFYFKRIVNDRIATLSWNYGRRGKDFLGEPSEEEMRKKLLGGSKGEGLAPWIYYLQALVAHDPQNADTMMLLAQINENTQADAAMGDVHIKTDVARAKALYKSVVDMDLKNLDAHAALARTLVATDEFEGAIQENWILEELSPVGKWQYVMNVGDLWALAGYHDKAIQNWNAVSEQGTTEPNLVYQLGCRMFQAGKLDEAVALLRKAAAANRNEFRFRTTLGNLLDLSSEKNGAEDTREEAVRELTAAVELAAQNPALSQNLQPVLRRLLDVEVRLARSRFQNRKYAECAQACSDASPVLEKLAAAAPTFATAEIKADIDVLRARALLESDRKEEGEALLRAAIAAYPGTNFWIDDALKIAGNQVLALFESGKLAKSTKDFTPAMRAAAIAVSPDGLISVPGRISAIQAGSSGALFLESGGLSYRVSRDAAAPTVNRVTLPDSSWMPLSCLHDDFAAVLEGSALSAFNLRQQTLLWKKEIEPSAVFASGSLVACIHSEHSAQKKPGVNRLMLTDRDSGREIWDVEAPAGQIVFSDKLLLVRSDNELVALRLENGTAAWRTPLSGAALWRRPALVHDTILLIDDMANEVFAYELNGGGLKFQRALRAALLCDLLSAESHQAIFHTLRNRVVTLECLDTATGRIVWERSLQTAAQNGAPESLGGIGLAPLFWKGWLLHLDALNHRIWAVRGDSGELASPVELNAIVDPKMFDDLIGWGIAGGDLYLAAHSGHIAWLKFAN